MQIQTVNNTQSGVNFQSKNNKIESASAFVNMDDAQVKELAYVMSYEQQHHKKKHHNNALNSLFYAIPIVDTLAAGVLTVKTSHIAPSQAAELRNAPMSARLFSAGRTAGGWAVALGVIGIYNVIKKAFVSNSKSAHHFQKDNPVASFIVDMGIIFAGFIGAAKGINKLAQRFPKATSELKAKAINVLEKSDKTNFNKKVLPELAKSVDNLAKRMPAAAKASRYTLANSVWILFGLGLLKMGHDQNKERHHFEKNVHKNFKEIKKAQLEVSKHLNKVLEAEKNDLVQSKSKVADDVNILADKTETPAEI